MRTPVIRKKRPAFVRKKWTPLIGKRSESLFCNKWTALVWKRRAVVGPPRRGVIVRGRG
jgi:hypothetical protein